ncbi:MAG: 4Fe-4S binding protein [Bacteroidia bacterium]|nr:4Fe-4S binding protein [Bacteroidia bacterium]
MGSLIRGVGLALRHVFQAWKPRRHTSFPQERKGTVTIPYPHQTVPVPENGHYRLHVAIEDCIGCDLCARICPVNCITIGKEKSPTVLGHASNGSPKRFFLPQFDIDHALCCFCGLCTIVCPTECITMEPIYAYATDNRAALVLRFGERNGVSAHPQDSSGGA